jgi:hypothetical protein
MQPVNTLSDEHTDVKNIGFYASLFLSFISLATFAMAITAVPVSGALCPDNCLSYPYLDTLSQFPKDYYWMFLAIPQIIAFVVFVSVNYIITPQKNKLFSLLSLVFTSISAIVLLACYFIQFSVVPASLISGETEGISLLTQYNPHGVFIAMEELGYVLMSIAFLFIAFTFSHKSRLQLTIRWIFIMAFILTIISFVAVTIKYGIVRDNYFEVAVISIDWIVLVVNGILTSVVFKRTQDKLPKADTPVLT